MRGVLKIGHFNDVVQRQRRGGDSQLGHVPWDAFGQRVQMLVAAADHRLQAGALGGTLRLGNAARLLLAWEEVEEGMSDREKENREPNGSICHAEDEDLSQKKGPEVRIAKKR